MLLPMSALTGSPRGPMPASRPCHTSFVCCRYASRNHCITSESGVAPSPRRLDSTEHRLWFGGTAWHRCHRTGSAPPLRVSEFLGVPGSIQVGHFVSARAERLRLSSSRPRRVPAIATRGLRRNYDFHWRDAAAKTAGGSQL